MPKKLYVEQEGVAIDESRIPKGLRDLVPVVREWCFIGETPLASKLKKASDDELRKVVEQTEVRLAAVQKYCNETYDLTPVPHEAGMFHVFLTNYLELRSQHWLRESKRKK